jgi:hypothetical protein
VLSTTRRAPTSSLNSKHRQPYQFCHHSKDKYSVYTPPSSQSPGPKYAGKQGFVDACLDKLDRQRPSSSFMAHPGMEVSAEECRVGQPKQVPGPGQYNMRRSHDRQVAKKSASAVITSRGLMWWEDPSLFAQPHGIETHDQSTHLGRLSAHRNDVKIGFTNSRRFQYQEPTLGQTVSTMSHFSTSRSTRFLGEASTDALSAAGEGDDVYKRNSNTSSTTSLDVRRHRDAPTRTAPSSASRSRRLNQNSASASAAEEFGAFTSGFGPKPKFVTHSRRQGTMDRAATEGRLQARQYARKKREREKWGSILQKKTATAGSKKHASSSKIGWEEGRPGPENW